MILQYQKLPVNIARYVIICTIILGLILVIPSSRLSVKDSLVLSIMLTLILSISEHVSVILTPDDKIDKIDTFEPVKPTITPTVQPTPTVIPTTIPTTENKEVPKTIMQQYPQPNASEKIANGSRDKNGTLNNELPYTDYNHLPMADSYKPSDFEYGDSFLPPEKWYPQPPFPPLCVSEKRCQVCPVFTTGTPVDVKEWNSSRRIMPPDNINIDYIKDKLNSGR